MDARQYVDAAVRKMKCTGKRKKEIKKQLLADIEMRVKQGNGQKTFFLRWVRRRRLRMDLTRISA